MGRGVSELFAQLANELDERATFRVERLGGGEEFIELVRRNPAAAKLAVEHDPDGETSNRSCGSQSPTKLHPKNR